MEIRKRKRSKRRQNELIDYPEDWDEWLGGAEVDTPLFIVWVCECVCACVCGGEDELLVR